MGIGPGEGFGTVVEQEQELSSAVDGEELAEVEDEVVTDDVDVEDEDVEDDDDDETARTTTRKT